MNDKEKNVGFSKGRIFKFVIPSVIGVLLLMTPFKFEGVSTVAVSLISKTINATISAVIPVHFLVLFCIVISCVFSIVYKIFKPKFIEENADLKSIFNVSYFWLVIRIVGLVFGMMTVLKIGPEIIYHENTGGLILFDLIGGLFTIFLVAGFVLPFLTEFGLLEFVGVYLTNVMRPVFNLPGRSAVDCVASWIGDGTIGVALTNKQYEEGYYTEKEAAVISTTFSAVSITFCLVVLQNVNLMPYFGSYYFAICLSGIIVALIIPRIPPLSKKKDIRLKQHESLNDEIIPQGYTKGKWALHLAIKKAEESFSLKKLVINGIYTVISLWLGVMPIIMAIGTLALVLSESTPIFNYLGLPFLPILNLFNIPEAMEASRTLVVGFADMVVPSILAAGIESEMTRFIIATVSVTQLIYMSETGAVILGSKLPVSLIDLFIIFIERTIISLPIIIIFAKIIF